MTDAFQGLVKIFSRAISNSVGIVGNIFLGCIVLSVVVIGIKLMFGMESGIQGIGGLVFTFIRFIFIHWLILNFSTVLSVILSIFAGIGNLLGEAGNATLSTREIVNNPFTLISTFWGEIGNILNMPLPEVPWYERMVLRLMSVLIVGASIFFLTKAAILVAIAIIEYYLIGIFSLFYVPFAAFNEMKNYYEKSMAAILGSALKCAAVVGIGALIQPAMLATLSQLGTLTLNSLGNYISMLFQIFSTAVLLYMIIEQVPGLIRGVLSGMPALNSQAASQAAGALAAGSAGLMGAGKSAIGRIGGAIATGAGAVAGAKQAAGEGGGGLGKTILNAGAGVARAAGRVASSALGSDKMKNSYNFGKASAHAQKKKE